jgi:phage host-nuclease inhibitor protein Gam
VSIRRRMLIGGLVLAGFMFLLWLRAESIDTTLRARQDVTAVNLRDVCRHLSDIQRDVGRLERLATDKDTKRAFGDLARHLHNLETTIDRGVILR